MDNESAFRNEIIEVGRRLYAKDFVASHDGNISIRISEREILITPTGVSKGSMTPDQIIKVDPEGKILSGLAHPSTELRMHLIVYQERPEVKAIVHAHPPTATGFAVAGIPFDNISLPEVIFNLGKIELSDYATPTTEQVPQVVAKKIADCDALLLANHGALTVGKTALEAYFRMETLEAVAKITLVAKTLGRENFLNDSQKKELFEIKNKMRTGNLSCSNCGQCNQNPDRNREPLPPVERNNTGPNPTIAGLEEPDRIKEIVYEVIKRLNR